MLFITLRDLQHRRTRVAVVTALVALVLTLLFLMTGLVNQLQTESARAVDVVGAEHWVVAEGVSGPFTSVSVLPVELAAELGGTAAVVSRGTLALSDGADTEIVVFGRDRAAGHAPTLLEGEPASAPDEVVVDESLGVATGATVTIGQTDYTVTGLTQDATVLAGLPFVFMDLGEAQELSFRTRDVVSTVLVDEDPGQLEGAVVRTGDDVAQDALGPLESAVSSIDLIRGLLWMVAAIVVGAVVYLNALERQRDFAVMRAVGASGRSLAVGLAVQAVVVALLGAIVAAVLATVVEPVFPLKVRVPDSAYLSIPVAAIVVGVLAASFGARRANRVDPAAAFGGAA